MSKSYARSSTKPKQFFRAPIYAWSTIWYQIKIPRVRSSEIIASEGDTGEATSALRQCSGFTGSTYTGIADGARIIVAANIGVVGGFFTAIGRMATVVGARITVNAV